MTIATPPAVVATSEVTNVVVNFLAAASIGPNQAVGIDGRGGTGDGWIINNHASLVGGDPFSIILGDATVNNFASMNSVQLGTNGTVDNFGKLGVGLTQATNGPQAGIEIGGGRVRNGEGATVSGPDGIKLRAGGSITVDNWGSIIGGNIGLNLLGSSVIHNYANSVISGGHVGISTGGSTITNDGWIKTNVSDGNDIAITTDGPTTIINGKTGKITGTSALQISDALTLTNYGRIEGFIVTNSSPAVTLAIAPGSSITAPGSTATSIVNVTGGAGSDGKRELQLIGGGTKSQDTYDGSFVGFRSLSLSADRSTVWTLTNDQSYDRGTVVGDGMLLVNGNLTSQVAVTSGVLGGSGHILGDVTVNSGGTLAPTGRLTVGSATQNANVTLSANATFRVNVSDLQNDQLLVNGKANLTGASFMALIGSGGITIGKSYVVLTASGGLSGTTFGSAANNQSAFLSTVLTYDTNNVRISFVNAGSGSGGGNGGGGGTGNGGGGTGGTGTGGSNRGMFASVALTLNQRAVGHALDVSNGGSQVFTGPILLALLPLGADQARSAYDSISGEGLAGAQNAAFRASSLFTSSVNDQANAWRAGRDGGGNAIVVGGNGALGYAPEGAHASAGPFTKAPASARLDRTWRVWGSAFGGGGTLQGDAGLGTAMQKDSLFGGNIGLDYQVWPNWLVGVAFGGSEGNFTVDSRATSGKVDGVHGGFYSMLSLGQFYLSNTTTVSSFNNKTTRFTGNFGGLPGETERGDFSSWQLRSRFEVGHDFDVVGARLTPFAAFEIAQLTSDGFRESSQTSAGAPGVLGLAIARQTTTSAPLFLGLRGERRIELANGMVLTPQASLAWVHEFTPTRNLNGSLVSLPGASFIVDGARPASDAAQVSVGAQFDVTRNAALFANFEGEFSNVSQAYAGKGGVRVAW
ncbi:autotransporter domain-containing protein [Bradyrhizobium sp. CER78]|uniref:autotransporter outer membrane beta-barrel domain-containing protein n=1 Tax=Bradyrhizobium sp. CER78 TaxID=3039162 RepID=UPI0024476C3C|nr:autotransporter domain-containing protein [Bradyrhizobium sp. CER78]MDH2385170.1 autotransporter domain-containing protein [Bradyrhizobium sp. CER78]